MFVIRALLALWVASVLACTTAPYVVRYRSEATVLWTYEPRSRPPPIEITAEQFEKAIKASSRELPDWRHPLEDARRLFDVPIQSGNFVYEVRTHRLIPEQDDSPLDEGSNARWIAEYGAWCAGRGFEPTDCLGILRSGHLTSQGRFVLALWISRGEVLEAAAEGARETGRPKAIMATLATACRMYLMLWALPEPISKGVAAFITLGLIAYLGFDTVLQLGAAFDQMVRESDQAKDFGELREAGQRFGKVFGQNAARLLIALAAAAIGGTGGSLAEKLGSLPETSQMYRLALERLGIDLTAASEVEAVTVSPTGVSISLATGSALMSSASAGAGGGPPRITFSAQGEAGHGARHLEGTGLQRQTVEDASENEIRTVVGRSQVGGSFWGRVLVQGWTIEFRAFRLPDGRINVGTYYSIP